jgi:hypothetical protein
MPGSDGEGGLAERVRRVLESAAVASRRPSSAEAWPFEGEEPEDLAALYSVSDGLELADGTVVLARGELLRTTQWLVEEKALAWNPEIVVLGERAGVVIARDPDRGGARHGGGVLEAPTDGLESFQRVALDVVGYLEARVGLEDPAPAPERVARDALAAGDSRALWAALARPFYPGAEREMVQAATGLGALEAKAGRREAALRAFELAVAARRKAVGRGPVEKEAAAAYRACAAVAAGAGDETLAALCRERAAVW